jgi:glycine cleavage system H lipoate-binding protein
MRCPFLREAEVESCGHSVPRRLIPRRHDSGVFEKCSTPAYRQCAVFAQTATQPVEDPVCPYLLRSMVQYCAAATITKFLPYNDEPLSRCGREAFRYCDVFLQMAHPDDPDTPRVDGIAIPAYLYYAPNHLWIDAADDGMCHIGIDGLLARVVERADRITFLTTKGHHRPAAVLSLRGVDLHMLFPNPLQITATNAYLRANPSKLTADPYRQGWLFEGTADAAAVRSGLLPGGEAATRWMNGEVERLAEFVHDLLPEPADGGMPCPDLLAHLDRGQMFDLFHAFFSPSVTWPPAERSPS